MKKSRVQQSDVIPTAKHVDILEDKIQIYYIVLPYIRILLQDRIML